MVSLFDAAGKTPDFRRATEAKLLSLGVAQDSLLCLSEDFQDQDNIANS